VIKDISAADVDKYIEEINKTRGKNAKDGKNLKPSTLKFVRNLIKNVIAYATYGEELYEPDIEGHTASTKNSQYEALIENDLRKICLCAKYERCPEMLAVLLMIYTGIRLGEICALFSDDIDFDNGTIYIRRSLHRLRNTDKNADNRTINVIAEIPTQNQIRYEKIPASIIQYVSDFSIPGTLLLTGEKDRPMEPRTLSNRVDKIFDAHMIEHIPFQRFRKTFTLQKADTQILDEVMGYKVNVLVSKNPVDSEWLRQEMANDLAALRMLLGLSPKEVSEIVGMSEALYRDVETGRRKLTWNRYLSILFFFHYNPKTSNVVEALGLYPKLVEDSLEI
jgi:integrase